MVFAPIVLDMASRPRDCSFIDFNWSWRHSGDLDHVWGGFEALKILSGECERLKKALTVSILFHSCTIGFAEKARGPSSQPLVQILPEMAGAVAHRAFTKGSKLLDARQEHIYDGKVHTVHQHFVKDIAYIISDLAVRVSEEGKAGGRMHCTSHAKHLVCSTQSLLAVVCVYTAMLADNSLS